MAKGPRLNNISRNFTTRNSLGIDEVANSISGELCPIVNSVTPRPFYWAFITWCYYDYYSNCNSEDRSESNVNEYIKMQNYFLALASNLSGPRETNGFTGADNIKSNTDLTKEYYSYDSSYLKNVLNNMGYYPPGLKEMFLVINKDPETNENYKYPHITSDGKELALAFDKIISNTEYYKKYRLTGKDIPKKVLIELNEAIKINLNNFDEVKTLLRKHLFEKEKQKKLIESHDYLIYLFNSYDVTPFNQAKCREVFFDYFSPRGNCKYSIPENLKEISSGWEIVVGRQYFTMGLEMIWKFMLESLNSPKTYKEWFNDCLNNSKLSFNLYDKLSSIISNCNYTYSERENMIANAKSKNNNHELNIENGIKIILSIYNRFNNRDDFSKDCKNYYNYGMDNNSISLNECFKLIEEYKDKSIEEFIKYIMYYYLLNQHMNTAFEKMLDGRDGYYVEKIENEYSRKEYYELDFQGIIMVQLAMVMRDLNVLEVE